MPDQLLDLFKTLVSVTLCLHILVQHRYQISGSNIIVLTLQDHITMQPQTLFPRVPALQPWSQLSPCVSRLADLSVNSTELETTILRVIGYLSFLNSPIYRTGRSVGPSGPLHNILSSATPERSHSIFSCAPSKHPAKIFQRHCYHPVKKAVDWQPAQPIVGSDRPPILGIKGKQRTYTLSRYMGISSIVVFRQNREGQISYIPSSSKTRRTTSL